ncbi:MAG: HNH endonuclease [Acidimicrobiales bacterium]
MARSANQRNVQKDPQRSFTPAQRLAGFNRCGNRCEHISIFGRRCTAAPTHGDHIWPHSKGGATTLANFAGLCARHNLAKGSRTPSRWAISRLERRRRGYFPPGEPVEVNWRVGRRY